MVYALWVYNTTDWQQPTDTFISNSVLVRHMGDYENQQTLSQDRHAAFDAAVAGLADYYNDSTWADAERQKQAILERAQKVADRAYIMALKQMDAELHEAERGARQAAFEAVRAANIERREAERAERLARL